MSSFTLYVQITCVKVACVDQISRSPQAESDKFMFDLFNLGQKQGLAQKAKKEISKEEILTMLYNAPS